MDFVELTKLDNSSHILVNSLVRFKAVSFDEYDVKFGGLSGGSLNCHNISNIARCRCINISSMISSLS